MQHRARKHHGILTTIGAALLSLAGCYNADALRHERTEAAQVLHMEEIDLGEFSICLPHQRGNARDSIVQFHVFGHVERHDREKVARALQTRGPELRSRMLMSVRTMTHADFDEPKLTKLRASVAEVINGALEAKLIQKVGFYNFSLNTI